MRKIAGVIMALSVVGLLFNSLLATITHSGENEKNLIPTIKISVPLSFPLEKFSQNVLSGGPGKDGIPAIDEPQFVSPEDADRFLDADDIVFGVELQGLAKAYPRKLLVWHEIVNDRFGNENVSVTLLSLDGNSYRF